MHSPGAPMRATQAAEPGPLPAHPALPVPPLQVAAEVRPLRPETSPQAGAHFTFQPVLPMFSCSQYWELDLLKSFTLCVKLLPQMRDPPAQSPVGPIVWKGCRIFLPHTKPSPSSFCTKAAVLQGCNGRSSPLPAQGQLCRSKSTWQLERSVMRGGEPQPLTVTPGRQLYISNQHTNLLLLPKCQASALRLLMWFILPPALPGTLFL